MYPIDGGDLLTFQMPRHDFVGEDHELFDDAMGKVAYRLGDSCDIALVVVCKQRFGKIKVDGATLRPPPLKDSREPIDLLNFRQNRCESAK